MARRSYAAIRLTRLPASTDATQPVSQLGQAVAALARAITNGAIEPCPACGRFDCDHDEWHEMMFTDPITIELTH